MIAFKEDLALHNTVPLNEILEDAQPNAIWLSVDKTDCATASVGDQVRIS
ncbi:protein of unknown function [Paenibacillus alvei]|uniref:Uncharacterized protein n=1 Tax=Paenibacillus alvei TaxID=44250 RepID=A0A383R817_PAEAL|nr:protein of unknown function [Paenibacillus alvei]